mmetsp:Transcript_60614/g.124759  ORF Transcript_60614/g.124759 Transcript_60614/m.124759 type:complete len:275 (+) Transcript_60614:3151-3975(+)
MAASRSLDARSSASRDLARAPSSARFSSSAAFRATERDSSTVANFDSRFAYRRFSRSSLATCCINSMFSFLCFLPSSSASWSFSIASSGHIPWRESASRCSFSTIPSASSLPLLSSSTSRNRFRVRLASDWFWPTSWSLSAFASCSSLPKDSKVSFDRTVPLFLASSSWCFRSFARILSSSRSRMVSLSFAFPSSSSRSKSFVRCFSTSTFCFSNSSRLMTVAFFSVSFCKSHCKAFISSSVVLATEDFANASWISFFVSSSFSCIDFKESRRR